MSTENYLSIFSRQMKATVDIYVYIFIFIFIVGSTFFCC